jgi:hypothetical protein
MSRWLHNVDAVRAWKLRGHGRIKWWTEVSAVNPDFLVGDFVGQGRTMDYCGLAYAVLDAVGDRPQDIANDSDLAEYNRRAADAIQSLQGDRPWQWFLLAILAFSLVWIQILMAFVVAFTSPTVGVGCWSGSFLIFGALSSFTWFVAFVRKSSGIKAKWLCNILNCVSLAWICFVVVLVVCWKPIALVWLYIADFQH